MAEPQAVDPARLLPHGAQNSDVTDITDIHDLHDESAMSAQLINPASLILPTTSIVVPTGNPVVVVVAPVSVPDLTKSNNAADANKAAVAPDLDSEHGCRDWFFQNRRHLLLILLVVSTSVTGIGNNISFQMIARRMTGVENAPWLLYATAFVYSVVYLGYILIVRPSWQMQTLWKPYLLMGTFIGIPSICSQFADPFVDPSLQYILNVLVVPGTVIATTLVFRNEANWKQLLGLIICMGGLLVYALFPALSTGFKQETTTVGCIAFIIGVLGASAVDVVQQRIFDKEDADVVVQLFVSNAVTVPLFVLSMFVVAIPSIAGYSVSDIGQQQTDAFVCFVKASDPLPANCVDGAWQWVMAFTWFYLVFFFLQAYLVKVYGAIFQSLIVAATTPGAALLGALDAFGGSDLKCSTLIGLLLIVNGLIVYWFMCDVQTARRQARVEADPPRYVWILLTMCLVLSMLFLLFLGVTAP